MVLKRMRNHTYDVMKGIAILLMVWEHCYPNLSWLGHQVVYSFHVPLFFLVGGLFAKEAVSFKEFYIETKKNAKRLLLPYVVTCILLTSWGIVQSVLKHDWCYIIRPILSTIWCSGDVIETKFGVLFAGPMWFLLALFWLREIFYCIQVFAHKCFPKYKYITIFAISTILSIAVQYLYPIIQPLPLGILPGVCGLLYYAIGWLVSKYGVPWYVGVISIACWPLSILFGEVELLRCSYTFPIDVLGACGATYLIYKVCGALALARQRIHTYIHAVLSLFYHGAGDIHCQYCVCTHLRLRAISFGL